MGRYSAARCHPSPALEIEISSPYEKARLWWEDLRNIAARSNRNLPVSLSDLEHGHLS
jgi:hypothetical protein